MKAKDGCEYLATAAHFAAESSAGTNVPVGTTGTLSVDARVYEVDPANGMMKIVCPVDLFDRNIIDTASALNSSVNDRRTLFGSCCSTTAWSQVVSGHRGDLILGERLDPGLASLAIPGASPVSMSAFLTHERTDSAPYPNCSATLPDVP